MSLSERLKSAMDAAGISQAELARACKVKPPSVNGWLSGKARFMRGENLLSAARALRVSQDWLATGRGSMNIAENQELSNTRPAPTDTRRIPILNKIPAGGPRQIVDDYLAGCGMEDIATDLKLGCHAFALIIDGDSMLPEFKTGDKVIIDPETKPRPGDFVAAKCNGDEGTFKKYRPRGVGRDGEDVFELTPLNDDYQTIRSDVVQCEIIGTMVEHRRLRRA